MFGASFVTNRFTRLAAAVAICGLAAAAPADAKPSCTAKGSHTLASSKLVRIYSVKKHHSSGLLYIGCERKTGRRTTIADKTSTVFGITYISRPKIAGRFVALKWYSGGGGGTTTTLELANLASRHITYLATSYTIPSGPQLGAFYLTVHGGIGWLVGTALEARRAHTHSQVQLDPGPVSKVSLAGTTLTWFSAGMRHTANLG